MVFWLHSDVLFIPCSTRRANLHLWLEALRYWVSNPAADTELEADVEPSKETEERLRAEAEEQRQREAAEAALALARQAEEAAEKQRAYELLAQRQAKQAVRYHSYIQGWDNTHLFSQSTVSSS